MVKEWCISREKMEKNKIVEKNEMRLKQSDYEMYRVILPYRFLFGRNRRRFIYSELEKMHPCFSDEFCFDSKIQKFSKKGLVSDVMVMHKYKLAEYEAGRSVNGTGFFAENTKRHRYFVDESFRKKIAVLFIVLAGSFVFTGWKLVSIAYFSSSVKDAVAKGIELETESESGESDLKVAVFDSWTMVKLFSELSNAGGRIISFTWKKDAFSESIDAKLKNIFPEQLSAIKILSVNYENGSPLIHVSDTKKSRLEKGTESSKKDEPSEDFYKNVRNAISDKHGTLREEKLYPYSVSFSCSQTFMSEVLYGLDACFSKAGKCISEISFSESDKGEWEIFLKENDGTLIEIEGSVTLKFFAENFELFGDEKKFHVSEKMSPKITSAASENKKNDSSIKEGALKIGEIKSADGRVIRFYKTSDGKIQKITGENN